MPTNKPIETGDRQAKQTYPGGNQPETRKTTNVQWYKKLPNKRELAFICFDVVEFYPSISEKLLSRALDFASDFVTISADDRQTITHAKHSLLFSSGDPWQKRNSNTLFDVTMGSYDGAETCELVGCYLLSQLKQIPDIDIGLYRDDGLAILKQTPREIERVKKEICKIFAKNDLRITIEANKKVVNFLDVTLDLNTENFKPYYVKTNIGRAFISLIDRCFPTGHKLRKIFNRNTIKLSYSCMPNVKQIIDGHNKNILKKAAQPQQDTTTKTCNCRKADECPLKGECLLKEVVYQAKVTTKELEPRHI